MIPYVFVGRKEKPSHCAAGALHRRIGSSSWTCRVKHRDVVNSRRTQRKAKRRNRSDEQTRRDQQQRWVTSGPRPAVLGRRLPRVQTQRAGKDSPKETRSRRENQRFQFLACSRKPQGLLGSVRLPRLKQPLSSRLHQTKPTPHTTPRHTTTTPLADGGGSGGGREEEEQGRAGVGAGAPLRRLGAGDDADGRRAAAQAAAAAAPARSATELRPAPTRQALRPRTHSAEAGDRRRRRQGPQGRRRRRRPAAGAAPVAVARAGGGGQAGGRGRHQRRPRGAARAGLRRAVRAPPLAHDAGGRELTAPRTTRRCGAGTGPGPRRRRGGRVVGRARRLRRRRPRARQVPLLNCQQLPLLCKAKTADRTSHPHPTLQHLIVLRITFMH